LAGILFIVSAPSGSGKSTLVSHLRQQVGGLEFSISWTTRAPRGDEQQDREYHFATRAEFEQHIADGGFLEWATVYDNYYGTSIKALRGAESRGNDLLLDIDVQGALQVIDKLPESVSIFIVPPSPQVLEARLRQRSVAEKMSVEEIIQRRLRQAHKEMGEIWKYRYALVNDVLDEAVEKLRCIVLAERRRLGQPESLLRPIPEPALGIEAIADRCLTSHAHTGQTADGLLKILLEFGVQ
jgi:guanylate kinase